MRLCYELAGIAGVDPGPHTLRELAWLADGARRDAWDRASLIAALVKNTTATKKADLTKPSDLHPYEQQPEKTKRKRTTVFDLGAAFIPNFKPPTQQHERESNQGRPGLRGDCDQK